jgi:hypothetical protein
MTDFGTGSVDPPGSLRELFTNKFSLNYKEGRQ